MLNGMMTARQHFLKESKEAIEGGKIRMIWIILGYSAFTWIIIYLLFFLLVNFIPLLFNFSINLGLYANLIVLAIVFAGFVTSASDAFIIK